MVFLGRNESGYIDIYGKKINIVNIEKRRIT